MKCYKNKKRTKRFRFDRGTKRHQNGRTRVATPKKKSTETERELRNQAKEEIDGKKKVISSLKSEIASLTNQCNELEQALNIPVYK